MGCRISRCRYNRVRVCTSKFYLNIFGRSGSVTWKQRDRHDIQNCVLIYWIPTRKLEMDTTRNVTKRNWRQTPNNTLLCLHRIVLNNTRQSILPTTMDTCAVSLEVCCCSRHGKKAMLDREANLCSVLTTWPPIPAAVRGNCANENKKKINKYIRISNLLNPSANRFVVIGDTKLKRSRAYCMNGRQELAERKGSWWRKRRKDKRKDKEGIMKEK